jgi:LPPG:FO 2-phospho-L-lactate transferase
MSNESVRTILHTSEGKLPFQQYFVKRACHPAVTAISFDNAGSAQANPFALEALADQTLGGVVLCPSNPYLSIDPILAVPGIKAALMRCTAPVVAVSPIIGGRAIKGPTAKIMTELGVPITVQAIVDHYSEILDGLIIDESDAEQVDTLDLPCWVEKILMSNQNDQLEVARSVLAFLDRLRW